MYYVVKAFKHIPAVLVQQALCLHDQHGIDIESCQGLITAASSMHDISNSYASVMPDWLAENVFNPNLRDTESTFINTATVTMCEQCGKWMIYTYWIL